MKAASCKNKPSLHRGSFGMQASPHRNDDANAGTRCIHCVISSISEEQLVLSTHELRPCLRLIGPYNSAMSQCMYDVRTLPRLDLEMGMHSSLFLPFLI